jgi:hypothetical protein
MTDITALPTQAAKLKALLADTFGIEGVDAKQLDAQTFKIVLPVNVTDATTESLLKSAKEQLVQAGFTPEESEGAIELKPTTERRWIIRPGVLKEGLSTDELAKQLHSAQPVLFAKVKITMSGSNYIVDHVPHEASRDIFKGKKDLVGLEYMVSLRLPEAMVKALIGRKEKAEAKAKAAEQAKQSEQKTGAGNTPGSGAAAGAATVVAGNNDKGTNPGTGDNGEKNKNPALIETPPESLGEEVRVFIKDGAAIIVTPGGRKFSIPNIQEIFPPKPRTPPAPSRPSFVERIKPPELQAIDALREKLGATTHVVYNRAAIAGNGSFELLIPDEPIPQPKPVKPGEKPEPEDRTPTPLEKFGRLFGGNLKGISREDTQKVQYRMSRNLADMLAPQPPGGMRRPDPDSWFGIEAEGRLVDRHDTEKSEAATSLTLKLRDFIAVGKVNGNYIIHGVSTATGEDKPHLMTNAGKKFPEVLTPEQKKELKTFPLTRVIVPESTVYEKLGIKVPQIARED